MDPREEIHQFMEEIIIIIIIIIIISIRTIIMIERRQHMETKEMQEWRMIM